MKLSIRSMHSYPYWLQSLGEQSITQYYPSIEAVKKQDSALVTDSRDSNLICNRKVEGLLRALTFSYYLHRCTAVNCTTASLVNTKLSLMVGGRWDDQRIETLLRPTASVVKLNK